MAAKKRGNNKKPKSIIKISSKKKARGGSILDKEKIEEIVDLIVEAREKIFPKARIEEITQLVGEREVEIRIKFDKLTIDGETTISFSPLKKRE